MNRSMLLSAGTRLFSGYDRLASAGSRQFFSALVAHYAVASVIGNLLILPLSSGGREDLAEMSIRRLLLEAVVVAPFVETALFQAFGYYIVSRLVSRFWVRVFLLQAPFAAVHFTIGWPTGVLVGGVMGFYLSYAFVARIPKSYLESFGMCWGLHALSNFIFVGLMVVERQ